MRRHELCCLLTHKAGIGSEQAAFAIMMSGTEDQKMKMASIVWRTAMWSISVRTCAWTECLFWGTDLHMSSFSVQGVSLCFMTYIQVSLADWCFPMMAY